MRNIPFMMAATVILLCGTARAADDAQNAERQKLVGTWKGFVVEGKGENPNRGPVNIELTITTQTMKGTQYQNKDVIEHGVGTYVISPEKSPKILDATKPRGNNNKDEWLGIYSLEGDTLKWCVRN
ncbi:MAG: TIGR03067 domain-containing protein [Candidatus Sumerlaeota bacterium]|nr:TIGR03067 domain-containing protein [Candidatus Sumerlaeota bacterium]